MLFKQGSFLNKDKTFSTFCLSSSWKWITEQNQHYKHDPKHWKVTKFVNTYFYFCAFQKFCYACICHQPHTPIPNLLTWKQISLITAGPYFQLIMFRISVLNFILRRNYEFNGLRQDKRMKAQVNL